MKMKSNNFEKLIGRVVSKGLMLFLAAFISASSVFAQAPDLMSYQAVIRDQNNVLVVNTNVDFDIRILEHDPNGTILFEETHNSTTNANGLVSVVIGDGQIISGDFSQIDWEEGPFYIEIDCPMYEILGTSQLLSVPYALYAKTSGSSTPGPAGPAGPQGPAGTMAPGNATGDILYWDGSAWAELPIGQQLQVLTVCDGLPVWTTSGVCPDISSLNCGSATNNGTLTEGQAASGVSSTLPYTGGNGNAYAAVSVTSTGVTGLTASISAGNFANGNGNLTVNISGTPASSGTASFVITIGGQTCTLDVIVSASQTGVFCGSGPTVVVDVTNPVTGKTWMDRNLGASQAATSSTDAAAYGDLYQWGRGSDGHQCRNSSTTTNLSSTDQPGHGDFIRSTTTPYDWRSPQNTNLWQGVNGVNNPCPSGYRLPTETELNAERLSWSGNSSVGAFASPLKLPMAGGRYGQTGSLFDVGNGGGCWSSTFNPSISRNLGFSNIYGGLTNNVRANALSVRCIKNQN